VLWVVQNGYVDEVPVESVKDFQTKLTEFLTTRKADLLTKIGKEKTLNDALTAELKAAAEEFKPTFTVQKPAAEKTQPEKVQPQPVKPDQAKK
jgi:F-type H+-transporting ATPase subunit alpha